jgi:hypothetical protein
VLGRLQRYEESYDALTKILSRDEAHANQDALAAKIEKPADVPKIPHPIANLPVPAPQETARVSNVATGQKPQ